MMVNDEQQRIFDTSEDHSEVSSSVDRISALPNEILGLILSFLTLKEATATRILSHRWEYLWILIPNKLDFDGTHSLRKVKMSGSPEEETGLWQSALDKERNKYIKWVDRAITLHRSMHKRSLEELRVSFDLTTSHADWIDDWLSYALSRKVQCLELNLMEFKADTARMPYNFPYKKGNLPNNFKMLKKLSMHSVNITGEAVKFFLGNCHLLEQLSVSESKELRYLNIVQTFPAFKCLEISSCHNLECFEICDSNVVTIKYGGRRISHYDFVLDNVPLLTELWVRPDDEYSEDCLADVVDMFSSVLPQLHMFKIYFTKQLSWTDSRKFVADVEMCNLKQMVVSLEKGYNDRDSLTSILNLIGASPCLQRFVLEAPPQHSKDDYFLDAFFAIRENSKSIPMAYFHHLKEVEFVGYRGAINQFEAIIHFVDNNVALESIVIDPTYFKVRSHRPWDRISRHKIEDEIYARTYAEKQLKEHVPSRINVKIL